MHERMITQLRAAIPAPEAAIVMRRASEVMSLAGPEAPATPRGESGLVPLKPALEIRF